MLGMLEHVLSQMWQIKTWRNIYADPQCYDCRILIAAGGKLEGFVYEELPALMEDPAWHALPPDVRTLGSAR